MGKIATSDKLPNPTSQIMVLKEAGVDAVDMEASSFMQTCWLFNKSCMVVRGVSNNANQSITPDTITDATNKASQVVKQIIKQLSK
jgi:nucleoside phosphorylase